MKKNQIQKKTQKTISKNNPSTKKINIFPNLSNQQFLKRSLKLLGVTDENYQKQTKCSLKSDLFPKSITNPSGTKQFFYICLTCFKNLASKNEYEQLKIWYPPRSVNQQIQFKKQFFKSLQKMEAESILPKNLLISKMLIMGQGNNSLLIQFLRVLSQLSLRALYIDKYSKDQRLIQISLLNNIQISDNQINKFYVYPFCQTTLNAEAPIKSQIQIQSIKKLYLTYIERYRKKLLTLQALSDQQTINPQKVMTKIIQQKQISQTLASKVSKNIFGQNRAFDRRIIMDKHLQIQKQLKTVECNFIQNNQQSILRLQGQTAKILSQWQPARGTSTLRDFLLNREKLNILKQKLSQKLQQLKTINKKIDKMQ